MDDLGGQTVHVIARRYAGHGNYEDDERTTYRRCSVQPMPPDEQQRMGLQVTRRWRLFGPPNLRAAARDELEVDGLLDEDDTTPLRLTLHGPAETWPDDDGSAHHVEALLDLTEGSRT